MPESSGSKSRIEKLSREEIFLLRKRMVFVWIFALIIGTVVINFLTTDGFSDMKIPLIVFSVFFFGILTFIVFVHTRNAFETNTTIYSGKITEKKTEASRTKNSQLNETYHVAFGNDWFQLELNDFQDVHVGDFVEIYTLRKKQVFKVEKEKSRSLTGDPDFKPKAYNFFTNFSEKLSLENKRHFHRAMFESFLLRTVLGAFGCFVLFWILILFLFFLLEGQEVKGSKPLIVVYYGSMIFVTGLFAILNRKLFKLGLDYFSGEKEVVIEQVIDRIGSTHKKNSPNSILQTTYSGYDNKAFFYLQTNNFWLLVDEKLFHEVSVGQNIEIHTGKRSRLILEVKNEIHNKSMAQFV